LEVGVAEKSEIRSVQTKYDKEKITDILLLDESERIKAS